MTALHPVLQWDLRFVRWMARCKQAFPWLDRLLQSTTSRYRTQDISLLLWLVFLLLIAELGKAYVWICVVNLLGVLLLQTLLQVERPIDVEPSLHRDPMCIDPDTWGFPCVDTHMSVVVLLPAVLQTETLWIQLAIGAVAAYMSLTKLWLASRFLTQVAGSWLTGFTGLLLGNHGHAKIVSYKLPWMYHTAAIVGLIALVAVVIGTWVENNESRLWGVPKSDYLEVLGSIMNSDGPAAAVDGHLVDEESNDDKSETSSDSQRAATAASDAEQGGSTAGNVLSLTAKRLVHFDTHGLGHARENGAVSYPDVDGDGDVGRQVRHRRADRKRLE